MLVSVEAELGQSLISIEGGCEGTQPFPRWD